MLYWPPTQSEIITIDFKSVQIGREVMESLRLKNPKRLWELYDYLRKFKEAAPLARWVFEAIAHGATAE